MRHPWKFKLTVDPAVAVGVYPIRVQTDDGISNPFLLAVGQLPQVVEKEENSTFELAQPIPDAAGGRGGEGRGQRRRLLPVPRAEGAADRRRCPVRPDRLGDRPDDPADDRDGPAPLRRLGRRHAGPAHRCPADRRACPRIPSTWSRSRTRATRVAGRPVYRLVDRCRADGRGGLSAGRPGRRDGRARAARRDALRTSKVAAASVQAPFGTDSLPAARSPRR